MKTVKLPPLVTFCLIAVLTFCLPVSVQAGGLPMIKGAPITGCFFLVLDRKYDFTIDYRGRTKLFFKKDRSKERVGQDYTVNVFLEVEHEEASGKVTKKKFDDDSFYAAEKPQYRETEQSYTVEVTGGAKVAVSVKLDAGRILLDAEIVDRGELKEGKLAVIFRVAVPAMYPSTYDTADKKKLKDKMRDDRFKITRASDQKTLSLKSYEMVDLMSEEIAESGFTSLSSEVGAQEGKRLTLTSASGKDALEISSRSDDESMLWKGYTVRWRRVLDAEGEAPSPLVIQVK